MWLIPLAVLVVVGGMFAWWRPPADTGLTGIVERGDLTVRLRETGVLRPAQSLTYHSPLAGRQTELLFLAPEGTRVQTGDLFAEVLSGLTEGDQVTLLDTPATGIGPEATPPGAPPNRASAR